MNEPDNDTPLTREEAARSQALATAINVVAALVALWTFLDPRPYQLALAAAILLPLIAVVITNHAAGRLRFAAGWRSRRAGLLPAVALPAAALVLRMLNEMRPLNWRGAVLVTAIAGGVLFGCCLVADASLRRRPTAAWLMLAVALLWGAGAGLSLNAMLDRSRARGYMAQITALRATPAHYNLQYFARLAPLGRTPWKPGTEIAIPRRLYESVKPGDLIILLTKPGSLHVAWYTFGPALHVNQPITLRPGGPVSPH